MSVRFFYHRFLWVLLLPCMIQANPPVPNKKITVQKTEEGRVFIIHTPVNDLDEFRKIARQAATLKPYGKVKINIAALADKSFHEIPAKGSSWHEYASSNPTPFKFFPDAKLAPFIPAEFIKKNRQLMLDKAKILREYGLEGAFMGYEPNFMPAAFFDAYPAMLGPRVDHPRRSAEKAFAPCVSVKETREMYTSMMAEMLKAVPEITTLTFKTNDAGAGICWADWLYSGPNGPAACKHFSMGERVKMLMDAYKEGANKTGKALSIYMDAGSSNFSEAERADIEKYLPENCYFQGNAEREIINTGGTLSSVYPVTGIINPAALVRQLRNIGEKKNSTIFIGLRAAYDRGAERSDITQLIFQIIEKKLKEPAVPGGSSIADLQELQQVSELWTGNNQGGADLFKAFVALDEAMSYKSSTFPRVHSLYWGVTERLINRPLVIAPQRLSVAEESYFLPYIFNVSEQEARMDYMDVHGGRASVAPEVVNNFVRRLKVSADLFDKVDAVAIRKDFFKRMAISLRIYASVMRSCANFSAAQAIRDRDGVALNGPVHRPDKDPSWTGHPDFIPFNNIMRDELDNTAELIRLLENGGLELLVYSKNRVYEDRFMLGPDIILQLKKKRKIMLDHWQDIEDYLASPFK
ncbi:MAG: hypothetical protein KF746_08070 [Chitinophagaceae bacterium]|nr:hypothetical protein [Chitinophagaceae bacterium]